MSVVEEGMAVALSLNRQPLVLAEVPVSVSFWTRGLGEEQEAAVVSGRPPLGLGLLVWAIQ